MNLQKTYKDIQDVKSTIQTTKKEQLKELKAKFLINIGNKSMNMNSKLSQLYLLKGHCVIRRQIKGSPIQMHVLYCKHCYHPFVTSKLSSFKIIPVHRSKCKYVRVCSECGYTSSIPGILKENRNPLHVAPLKKSEIKEYQKEHQKEKRKRNKQKHNIKRMATEMLQQASQRNNGSSNTIIKNSKGKIIKNKPAMRSDWEI